MLVIEMREDAGNKAVHKRIRGTSITLVAISSVKIFMKEYKRTKR